MQAAHLFLPLHAVLHKRSLQKQLHPVYQDACRFFHCTLIDRTQTLETGLEFQILEPLEGLTPASEAFYAICDRMGQQVARQALAEHKTIQLLWSGGIDSTTALVALYRALEKEDRLDALHVLLSQESIHEYQRFFAEIVQPRLCYTIFTPPLYSHLDSQCLVVTGEHGDQLFGSDKLRPFVLSGQAFRPYEEVLPVIIDRKLGRLRACDKMMSYLQPQIQRAPVPIDTLYDYLWWMNFSMKWQFVSLRLLAHLEPYMPMRLDDTLIHFFQHRAFQQWALRARTEKIKDAWPTYKYPAKAYIYAFHEDPQYLEEKEKEQSLKEAIVQPRSFFRLPHGSLINTPDFRTHQNTPQQAHEVCQARPWTAG